jgi:hypothetical protein
MVTAAELSENSHQGFDVTITDQEVSVSFHRRAHLPIILASNLIEKSVKVPWWDERPLRLTTCNGPANRS